jgi:hypothetical protein
VPSLLKLIGKYSWYLPAWLSWMPDVAIEGKRPVVPSSGTVGSLAPVTGGDD